MLGLLEGELSANTPLSKDTSDADLPGGIAASRSKEVKDESPDIKCLAPNNKEFLVWLLLLLI